jgi:hypothetical protein
MSDFLIDEETELLAAEFVLGTLDSEERAHAHGLLKTNHAFIGMVRIWERRFSELHLMVEPVEPDAAILRRIKVKILSTPAGSAAAESKAAAPVAAPPPPVVAEPAGPQMPKAANIELKPLQSAAEEAGTKVAATASESAPAEIAPIAAAATSAAELASPTASSAAPLESTAPAAVPPAGAEPAAVSPSVTPPAMFPPPMAAAPGEAASPAEAQPAPEVRPQEIKSEIMAERDGAAKVAKVAPPLTAPKLAERFPTRTQGRRGGGEVTIDVIRSRGRWRVFGILMSLMVVALVGLLAAWRFAPDRLPPELRPAQFFAALAGAGAVPRVEIPAVKPAPPTGQFDE